MPTKPSSSKPAAKSTKFVERRHARRAKVKLLTAFRSLEASAVLKDGFVRALDLSTLGALLESPDPFVEGQQLSLEFLIDNNRIVQVNGKVNRVTRAEEFYLVAVVFEKLSARAKRLISEQVGE